MKAYPEGPGFARDSDTSYQAAEEVSESKEVIAYRCLASLEAHGPQTADEIAEHIGLDILSVRPRITELKACGAIKDAGERRRNKRSGKMASVVRLVPVQPGMLF